MPAAPETSRPAQSNPQDASGFGRVRAVLARKLTQQEIDQLIGTAPAGRSRLDIGEILWTQL